ncbi:MAG: outer membrane beta-barrel domain-containing protein [Oligoflexales bacterium]|nr:outer membrane beta-barrel domain-containing protein [Oligoflexales bacterium]
MRKKSFYFDFDIRKLCFALVIITLSSVVAFESIDTSYANDERFTNFEIRVIRPRFFSKRKKFELGTEGVVITNQTFIYTYLASGILTYHFTEALGLEVSATFGTSINKEDKVILEKDFNIKTQIIRTKTIYSGSLLWTPIYGKYQLASGKLIYFDTYLIGGVGTTGVEYQFDHCDDNEGELQIRSDYIAQYPTFTVGVGQRFFLDRKSSFKWNLRNHSLQISSADGTCVDDPDIESIDSIHYNLTMQIGYSRFF